MEWWSSWLWKNSIWMTQESLRFHQHTPNRLTVCQPDQTCFADTFVQHAQPVSAFSSCKNMARHMLLQRLQIIEGNSHPACNPEPCTNYRAHFKGMLGISPRAWNICGWTSFEGALIFHDDCWDLGWDLGCFGAGFKIISVIECTSDYWSHFLYKKKIIKCSLNIFYICATQYNGHMVGLIKIIICCWNDIPPPQFYWEGIRWCPTFCW